jgi:hypothetical protein
LDVSLKKSIKPHSKYGSKDKTKLENIVYIMYV